MDFGEFQESELMFSDYSSDQSVDSNDSDKNTSPRMKMLNKRKCVPKSQRRKLSSTPINIPSTGNNNSFRHDINDVGCSELFDDEYFDKNEEQWRRLPPHLIVERRANEEMARSFSPLKGRNLCEVRTSILRMTGFLER